MPDGETILEVALDEGIELSHGKAVHQVEHQVHTPVLKARLVCFNWSLKVKKAAFKAIGFKLKARLVCFKWSLKVKNCFQSHRFQID